MAHVDKIIFPVIGFRERVPDVLDNKLDFIGWVDGLRRVGKLIWRDVEAVEDACSCGGIADGAQVLRERGKPKPDFYVRSSVTFPRDMHVPSSSCNVGNGIQRLCRDRRMNELVVE